MSFIKTQTSGVLFNQYVVDYDRVTGATGPTGSTGATGDPGPQGATGATGAAGSASGFATTELDNLTTTAVNTDIISDTDNTDSLGLAAKRWAEVHGRKGFFIDNTSGGTVTLSNAGIISGKVDATGNLRALTLGSFATGYAKGNGGTARVEAITKPGTFAAGYAFCSGAGQTSTIRAAGGGAFVSGYTGNPLGYNTNASSLLYASSYGTFVQGWAGPGYYDNAGASPTFEIEATNAAWGGFAQGISYGYYGNETRIKSSGRGSFSQGYAGATGSGYSGVGHLYASGKGALCQGVAIGYSGTGLLLASGNGSFVHGYTSDGTVSATALGSVAMGIGNVLITSTAEAAVAIGYSRTGSITASGKGAWAIGDAYNYNILSSGYGNLAIGSAQAAAITASGTRNCFQFGEGTNALINSLQVGSAGLRFKGDTGAPGTPQNGDHWVASSQLVVRSDGVNWTFDQSSAWTPTNVSTDRSFDANSTSVDELADALGTLVSDLQTFGVLG